MRKRPKNTDDHVSDDGVGGKAFNQRFNELMNLDVDLGDTELPIEISENEDIKLSYSDLTTLRKFIKLTGGENEC